MNVYTLNGQVLTNDGKWLKEKEGPAPVVLPPKTIRVKLSDGASLSISDATCTQVSSSPNIWDVTTSGDSWSSLFRNNTTLIEVLGANTDGITAMDYMFGYCKSLTTVPAFDISSVLNVSTMFTNCKSLTTVPLFDTSSVTNMNSMFSDCTNVESGALALYQQASSQTTPPSNHSYVFWNCGNNTVTGAAELAQIPSSWGGTGA